MALYTVHANTQIDAPIERCFLLSTRIELVQQMLGMTAVGDMTRGHVKDGSLVVWRGWKFGLPTEHHTLITAFDPPHDHFVRIDHHEVIKEAFFQDTQQQGRFASFQHDHYFGEIHGPEGTRTSLEDEVRFSLPFGWVGKLAALMIVAPHIRRLTARRFALIKTLAEGEGWREWAVEPCP